VGNGVLVVGGEKTNLRDLFFSDSTEPETGTALKTIGNCYVNVEPVSTSRFKGRTLEIGNNSEIRLYKSSISKSSEKVKFSFRNFG
jgi:hypothetical protein